MKNKKQVEIISVNISEKKGTIKKAVDEIVLDENGIKNDAHAAPWHRQISLLGVESFEKFEIIASRKVNYGEFAENITTKGIELYKTHPLDRFILDSIELEVTQIGKKCHGDSCAIYREVGSCVMPKEGIFCRVIKPGTIKPGQTMTYIPKVFKVLIITLSDRAFKGIYPDKSGPKIKDLTEEFFSKTNREFEIGSTIIPDDKEQLQSILLEAKKNKIDFIFTTGGTGIGTRDFTPEIVSGLLDKEIPGIMESIRIKFGSEKPNALLSRGVAGVMDNSLIYTLPGSVKAVQEYLSEIFKTLLHLKFMLHNLDVH
ncbi:MAG: hypothetical protein JEY97_04465 [Bacteroidales bacterium]|nr:hypothetical protein [Bacteroidales bacterium]